MNTDEQIEYLHEVVAAPVTASVAARYNSGKPELSYLLDFPKAVVSLARVCEYGANKYARDNWKKGGKPDAEYVDAALRHLLKYWNGERVDKESGCLHVAHAVWNMMALIELNDEENEDADTRTR